MKRLTKLPKKHTNLYTYMPDVSSPEYEVGYGWYKDAHAFACELADMYNLPLESVCGVIAVLSPACSWEINKRDACTIIAANPGMRRFVTVSTYGQNKNKAIHILGTGDISVIKGRKVFSFYMNILEPDNPNFVTIDRHAARACYGKFGLTMTAEDIPPLASAKRYNTFKNHYLKQAKTLDLNPNTVQALVWTGFKQRMKG